MLGSRPLIVIEPSAPPQLAGSVVNVTVKVGVETMVNVIVALALTHGERSVVQVKSTVPAAMANGPGVYVPTGSVPPDEKDPSLDDPHEPVVADPPNEPVNVNESPSQIESSGPVEAVGTFGSATVTFDVQDVLFPEASSTVSVTTFTPTSEQVNEVMSKESREIEQLSDDPASTSEANIDTFPVGSKLTLIS